MRLTAGRVLLDQSMLTSESGFPSKSGDPVSWCCRFVASSGRAGHCDTGSAFVPPIASLIAAATADRSVLAIAHDFEVIPVMAFLRGRSERQSSRPASCSSLPISRISTGERHCWLVKPAGRRRPHFVRWSRDRDVLLPHSWQLADVADPIV